MESPKGRGPTGLGPKHNRKTHEERAHELLSAGALKPRLVDEHGLSVYTGIAVATLRNARVELPKKWTPERLRAAMESGLVSPPVTMIGGKKMYDLSLVDKWIELLPVLGQLPEEAAS